VEASSGGGMVNIVMNGKQEALSIRIDPEVVNREDIDMLQDLMIAAVNEAIRKSQEMMTEEMKKSPAGSISRPILKKGAVGMALYAKPIDHLIEALMRLPGIGKKTASRLAFHILRSSSSEAQELARSILDVKEKIRLCSTCFNLTDEDPCRVCQMSADTRRSCAWSRDRMT